MKVIHQVHPEDFVRYSTEEIRKKFLLDKIVSPGKIECAYTHYDRMIVGAAVPTNSPLELGTYEELKAVYFLSRRELGVVSIAGKGTISVDGEKYAMDKLDCLYIGMGKQKIRFAIAIQIPEFCLHTAASY